MTRALNAYDLDRLIPLAYERARGPWSLPWHELPSGERRRIVAACLRAWRER